MAEALADAPPEDASAALMTLMFGRWAADMIGVVAGLGVSDELVDGPLDAGELARRTGAHADTLRRVLRALASLGVYRQRDDDRFSLAPAGALLRSDGQGSLRELAIMLGQPWHARTWDGLASAVRRGCVPFEEANGMKFFDYMRLHAQAAANFDGAMAGFSELTRAAVADAYDFGSFERVVDVGGGHGTLLRRVLSTHRAVTGILFEREATAGKVSLDDWPFELRSRCSVVGGDFFDTVPAGADAYMLTGVLHDWDDEPARAILRACRAAIPPDGRLVVGEQVLPEGDAPSLGKLLDIEMLITHGGRERTEAEYRALLLSAGFHLSRILPTDGPTSVLEAVPA